MDDPVPAPAVAPLRQVVAEPVRVVNAEWPLREPRQEEDRRMVEREDRCRNGDGARAQAQAKRERSRSRSLERDPRRRRTSVSSRSSRDTGRTTLDSGGGYQAPSRERGSSRDRDLDHRSWEGRSRGRDDEPRANYDHRPPAQDSTPRGRPVSPSRRTRHEDDIPEELENRLATVYLCSVPKYARAEDVESLLLSTHQVAPIAVRVTLAGGQGIAFAAYLSQSDVDIILQRMKGRSFLGCEVTAFPAKVPRHDDGTKRSGEDLSLPPSLVLPLTFSLAGVLCRMNSTRCRPPFPHVSTASAARPSDARRLCGLFGIPSTSSSVGAAAELCDAVTPGQPSLADSRDRLAVPALYFNFAAGRHARRDARVL